MVYVDADQIKQIILNLVTNAVQAIDGAGEIHVAVDKVFYRVLESDVIRLQVRDSGPGFPDEVRGRLFDPFFTTKSSGTGLGLHISQNMVLEHGGRMEASNHPSGGAVVSMFLPLPDEKTLERARRRERARASSGN